MATTPIKQKLILSGKKPKLQQSVFEITESYSSSDIDLDLDMESIPVGKEKQNDGQSDSIETPAEQENQVPELEDSDDEEQVRTTGNKLGLLYDFLLTQEQCNESLDEWTYRSFMKEFAIAEADQVGDEIDEEYRNVEEEEEV
ncbi:hypothetical protein M9Y10_032706 [Tritrichomonas musculus]|uniref:Uncharacterized protein n=1 Tax=Tritrichomonas musculus TaxID=1915356 RepID=A0ABR2GXL9_9EUKA